MSLVPGQRLGSFEIVAPIGAGGMGEVYRASDTRLGREVALKVLRDEVAGEPERLDRFEREARLLAAVNHPNIAILHGIDEADGIKFFVMELVPGVTLSERLAGGPLPVAEALTVARQVADALQAAHDKGIIHRDLKPANIKITPDGVVKVLDFGLAKATAVASDPLLPTTSHDGTREGAILGTPAYMSPEQVRGRPLDARTDIWSFGCVLFEALAGRRAFPGETMGDTFAAVLEREPDWARLPATTPTGVRDLLYLCLQKDRARRAGDVRDLRGPITEALTHPHTPSTSTIPPNPVPATSETQTLVRPRRRRRWILPLIIGLAILLFGVVIAGVIVSLAEDNRTTSASTRRAGAEQPEAPRNSLAVFSFVAVDNPDHPTHVYPHNTVPMEFCQTLTERVVAKMSYGNPPLLPKRSFDPYDFTVDPLTGGLNPRAGINVRAVLDGKLHCEDAEGRIIPQDADGTKTSKLVLTVRLRDVETGLPVWIESFSEPLPKTDRDCRAYHEKMADQVRNGVRRVLLGKE